MDAARSFANIWGIVTYLFVSMLTYKAYFSLNLIGGNYCNFLYGPMIIHSKTS